MGVAVRANVKFAVACAHLEVADVDDHGEHHHEAVRLVLVKSAVAAPGGFEEMEAPAFSSLVIFRVRCVVCGGGWTVVGRTEGGVGLGTRTAAAACAAKGRCWWGKSRKGRIVG